MCTTDAAGAGRFLVSDRPAGVPIEPTETLPSWVAWLRVTEWDPAIIDTGVAQNQARAMKHIK